MGLSKFFQSLSTAKHTKTVQTLWSHGLSRRCSVSAETQSLAARLGFVVQELENINKQKADKGAALAKLRAWRDKQNQSHSKNLDESAQNVAAEEEEVADTGTISNSNALSVPVKVPVAASKNEIVHPWPEWLDLMERLVQHNYFDHRRFDEDGIIENLTGEKCVLQDDSAVDVFRDLGRVRRACLDFGKDRFDILKKLTRRDIQIAVGYGCPTIDKKVVFSAKRLRAYVRLDEGDVCSGCPLRSRCEIAFMLPHKEEPVQTMDIMRILAVYGLDPLINSVENKLHKRKTIKTSIRKLLEEVVALSAVPIDPNLPKPVFEKPPPKVKQPPPPPRRRIGRDDIEMKKGDWVCSKCDFMNFAKNHSCLQCEAKRPKRELNPGEWECPKCNFLNYRRNMTCYNCDLERPEDEYTNSGRSPEDVGPMENPRRQQYAVPKLASDDTFDRSKVWNDDFDDDESDGAEVATFEYANISRVTDESLDDNVPDDYTDSQMNGPRRNHSVFQRQRREQNEWDLEMHRDPPTNGNMSAFNDFGDFDGVQAEPSKRDTVSSINPKRNTRLSASREDSFANPPKRYQGRVDRSYPSSSRRRGGRYGNSTDSEDDDFDSFTDSDDETGWKMNKKSRVRRGKDERNWSKRVRNVSRRPGSYESEEDAPHFPQNNFRRSNASRRGIYESDKDIPQLSGRSNPLRQSFHKSDNDFKPFPRNDFKGGNPLRSKREFL